MELSKGPSARKLIKMIDPYTEINAETVKKCDLIFQASVQCNLSLYLRSALRRVYEKPNT